MDAEQLMARVEELTGGLSTSRTTRQARAAEELTSAVVQMYGAGLERIVRLDRRGHARRVAQTTLVAAC